MTVLDGAWMFSIFFIANGLSLHITPTSAMYATFYSFFIVMGNIVALFAIRHGKVAVVSLYMLTGGMVFPVIYGVLMLGETLNLYKEIGLVLILLSFFPSIMLKKRLPKELKTKSNKIVLFRILCIAAFVCNGMLSVLTKGHSINVNASSEKDFLIFAALLRLVVGIFLIVSLTKGRIPTVKITSLFTMFCKNGVPKNAVYILLIVGCYTLCNGIANMFSMITAKTMNSSIQFPLLSGTVVVLTALASWAVYKEKPSIGDVIGIGFTFGGIGFMML